VHKLGVSAALAALLPLGFANPVKNWVEFRNPIYPLPIVGAKVDAPGEMAAKPDIWHALHKLFDGSFRRSSTKALRGGAHSGRMDREI
jgi:hypothetical protein